MHLPTLANSELIQHAWAGHDPLTSTELQYELLRRFTTLMDEAEADRPLLAAADDLGLDNVAAAKALQRLAALEHEFRGWDIPALLETLSGADVDDPAQLKRILDRDAKAEQIRELAQSATDALAELNTLFTPA